MGAYDRKFNTNDQQARAHALEIANSNALQGTPTELIIAEAEKIKNYVIDGLEPDTELTQTVRRVIMVRSLQQAQALEKQELRNKRVERDLIVDRALTQKAVAEVDEDDPLAGKWEGVPALEAIAIREIASAATENIEDPDEQERIFQEKVDAGIAEWREKNGLPPYVVPEPEAVEEERSDDEPHLKVVPEPNPELERLLAEEEAMEAEAATTSSEETVVASSPADREEDA